MYVHTDLTAVLPWLTHALFQLKCSKRKPFRLMDKLEDAVAGLDAEIRKRRKTLLETVRWTTKDAV